MRKVSLAVIASFAALVITTSVTGGAFDVGGSQNPALTIVKQINGDQDPPEQWVFTVTSENCGASILGPEGEVSSLEVTIAGRGGQVILFVQDTEGVGIGVETQCTYGVVETPVEGWVANPEAYTRVFAGETATFVNTAETTTSTTSSTTSTSVAPTTSGDETTTTAAVTTAAPQLPATGSDSNTQLALIAGAVLLTGLAATMASRRRPAS